MIVVRDSDSGILVSAIIPTRNRASRLPGAIRSALNQTVRDVEVVVVDDASDDDTSDILAALQEAEPRVRPVRVAHRSGAAHARNVGAKHARGSVLAFLDDDCAWHPEKLEAQLEAMSPTHGASYTRQATLYADGNWVLEGRAIPDTQEHEGPLRTNFLATPSLMVRRDIFDRVGGFDEELPRLQDWDLALTLIRQTRMAFVPRVLVRSEMMPEGISTDPQRLHHAARRMIERHEPHLTRAQLAALHYGLGKVLLVEGLQAAALGLFREAVRLSPFSSLNWAGLAAGLLGPLPARAVRALRRTASLRHHGSGDPGSMELLNAGREK